MSTNHETRNVIKREVTKCLEKMVIVGEEQETIIINKAFHRAIHQLESDGFLSLDDIRYIVCDEAI